MNVKELDTREKIEVLHNGLVREATWTQAQREWQSMGNQAVQAISKLVYEYFENNINVTKYSKDYSLASYANWLLKYGGFYTEHVLFDMRDANNEENYEEGLLYLLSIVSHNFERWDKAHAVGSIHECSGLF